jgi:hypothetical protein
MKQLIVLFLLCLSFASFAQDKKGKLKLFVDCNTYCDFDYLKREITLVDFTLDNKDADVHILITEQSNGGGGSQFQLIFFGQNGFRNMQDTLRYNVEPNSTDFMKREQIAKYIQLGLAPYVAKTDYAKYATINLKQNTDNKDEPKLAPTKDKWNYWVFNVGVNGNLSGSKVYEGFYYRANVSASRVTEDLKIRFSINSSKNKDIYHIEDPYGSFEPYDVINSNHSSDFSHLLVKSINKHWSYGYSLNVSQSSFSNLKAQTVVNPAIEYNIFPYTQSTTKLLTLRYGLDIRRNDYYDTTIFIKTNEVVAGHGLNVGLSFTQKWGTSYVGIDYHNYFKNNWKFYNVGLSSYFDVRITRALSFYTQMFGGLVRDQIYLSGKNAKPDDILVRRRQLASTYNYYCNFGINYRFGSKLNNFVNPRFNNLY